MDSVKQLKVLQVLSAFEAFAPGALASILPKARPASTQVSDDAQRQLTKAQAKRERRAAKRKQQ